MLKRKNFIKSIIVALILSSSVSYGEINKNFALGPKFGTQGLGIEARLPIRENIYGRFGANYFSYKRTLNKGQVNYKGKVDLLTIPLMLDYHPNDNSGFKVSLGAAYNGNKISLTGKSNKPVTLNKRTYSVEQVGSISGELKLGNSIAGLVTIGYDNSFLSNEPMTFAVEGGIMYSGNPKLKVSSDGLVSKNKQFINDLTADANQAVNDLKKYLRFYPILAISIRYNF